MSDKACARLTASNDLGKIKRPPSVQNLPASGTFGQPRAFFESFRLTRECDSARKRTNEGFDVYA
jgi:hypothetical protein